MNASLSPQIAPQIRRMAASDLPRILEMTQSLKNVPRWPPAAWLAALNPAASPRRIALVAEVVAENPPAGPIQGFAVAALLPPQAELETIAVLAEARRQHVGSRLIAVMAEELSQAGIRELFLEVRISNHAAQAFYQALGFSQTGRRTRYYIDPVEDAVLMERRLL